MNKSAWTVAAVAISALGHSDVTIAMTQHVNKSISLLEVAVGTCYFFKLDGVAQADPAVPNSPWFAVSTSQANAKEMYALLLSVRASGGTLSRVLTSGAVVCGEAQVVTIDF